jgi:hypothetical protein
MKRLITAGNDAHLYFEIGRGRTIDNSKVKKVLKKEKRKFQLFLAQDPR